jgi:hypothetical protein
VLDERGEPGAKRFGQLVQRLRKEKRLWVEKVATQAELSVGTIRAIEQGRLAPYEESGAGSALRRAWNDRRQHYAARRGRAGRAGMTRTGRCPSGSPRHFHCPQISLQP